MRGSASFAGAMRVRGLGEEDICAALSAVAHRVPTKTDADFQRIAKSYANYAPGSSASYPKPSANRPGRQGDRSSTAYLPPIVSRHRR